MVEKDTQTFNDIWSLKDDVIKTNNIAKKETFDIPENEMIATNIKGFIINSIGNIVAQFGFFVETETNGILNLKISQDGFMAGIYKKSMNILVGYGHPAGIHGLVDAKDATIITLSPEHANGSDMIISVENDSKLQDFGLVCVIRADDVDLDVLSDEVKEDFIESLELALEEVVDLNEIEASYNAYLKHIFMILGNDYENVDSTIIEKEEIYE